MKNFLNNLKVKKFADKQELIEFLKTLKGKTAKEVEKIANKNNIQNEHFDETDLQVEFIALLIAGIECTAYILFSDGVADDWEIAEY